MSAACPECGTTDLYGIEVQGVYDGILVWQCMECSVRWPRFGEPGRLHALGRAFIEGGRGWARRPSLSSG